MIGTSPNSRYRLSMQAEVGAFKILLRSSLSTSSNSSTSDWLTPNFCITDGLTGKGSTEELSDRVQILSYRVFTNEGAKLLAYISG